jgi:hypothetical protein
MLRFLLGIISVLKSATMVFDLVISNALPGKDDMAFLEDEGAVKDFVGQVWHSIGFLSRRND